jgi:hypothetical protein
VTDQDLITSRSLRVSSYRGELLSSLANFFFVIPSDSCIDSLHSPLVTARKKKQTAGFDDNETCTNNVNDKGFDNRIPRSINCLGLYA